MSPTPKICRKGEKQSNKVNVVFLFFMPLGAKNNSLCVVLHTKRERIKALRASSDAV